MVQRWYGVSMASKPTDWLQWHAPYTDPASPLSRRLAIVRRRLRRALPAAPRTPIQIIDICAGQGDALLGTLAEYPHADQVRARLVELDERNVAVARQRVATMGLRGIEIACDDAALLSAYAGAVPADIVLACGVFGNISDADILRIVRALPQLCGYGATVIWTRSRRAPDATPAIRRSFADHGFIESEFVAPDDVLFSVGVNRFRGATQPLQPGQRMFTFVARTG